MSVPRRHEDRMRLQSGQWQILLNGGWRRYWSWMERYDIKRLEKIHFWPQPVSDAS